MAARAAASGLEWSTLTLDRASGHLLSALGRGEQPRARIRCRWKGEDPAGRPGPYAPDIDDGVKVNIRPFQELDLLAVKAVIKKW